MLNKIFGPFCKSSSYIVILYKEGLAGVCSLATDPVHSQTRPLVEDYDDKMLNALSKMGLH